MIIYINEINKRRSQIQNHRQVLEDENGNISKFEVGGVHGSATIIAITEDNDYLSKSIDSMKEFLDIPGGVFDRR